jgi:hypothetical protein
MSKRPAINLSDLTSEAAVPMPEAAQRTAQGTPTPLAVVPSPAPSPAPASAAAPAAIRRKVSAAAQEAAEHTKTADLQPLAFKVSPAFSKRFRRAAFDADLKLNELLFEAFEAWEEKQNSRK